MKEFFAGRDAELLTADSGIPGIRVWSMELEKNDLGHMSCRLMDAVTFVYICKGSLVCQVNQGKEELAEGQGLFINSGNAYRFKECSGDCRLYLAEIEAPYLNTDALIKEKYVNPVMENEGLFYLCLDGKKESQREWADSFLAMGKALEKKETGYELEMRSCVCSMWRNLFKEVSGERPVPKKAEIREKEKLCRMLEFLHIHYREKITLTEMAENSQVSTGEYCRFFKKRMEQTPFEYLQACRIEKSIPEILEKAESITKIAVKYGFTGSSYYAETFRKEMGCTPGEYRKWYFGEMEESPVQELRKESPKTAKKAVKTAAAPEAEPPAEKPAEAPKAAEKPVSTRRSSMPAHLL